CLLSRAALDHRGPHSFPTRRSSDLELEKALARAGRRPTTSTNVRPPDSREVRGLEARAIELARRETALQAREQEIDARARWLERSEEHTSELQSLRHLVCRLLLEKK